MTSANILKNISVDCVVFAYENNALRVLLRQKFINYRGRIYEEWKLPGSLILKNETTDAAAIRVLKEQCGILESPFIKQFACFSDLNRLRLRERDYKWKKEQGVRDHRIVTIAYYSLVNFGEVAEVNLPEVARWHKVSEIKELIYDHKEILHAALIRLREDLLIKPIVFELLPRVFTLTELQTLYEIILDITFDKRNFRRRISNMEYLVPTNMYQEKVNHKPAMLYTFDREIYEKVKHERFDFFV